MRAATVTPDGFPLAYEVLPGNTLDKKTLKDFLAKIETRYGKADRVWVMDRGIPTEETLALMRDVDPPVRYLVGTPKGRLTELEKSFLAQPWTSVREQVTVKRLNKDGETYVLARSAGRRDKEQAMRRRRLKRLWRRLKELRGQDISRDDERIEALIFLAFLAYCLQVTLKARLRPLAPGLTPRAALDNLAAIHMVDVHLPTTDGRTLILSRYTEPEQEQRILLDRLRLIMPEQPPPRITSTLQSRSAKSSL